MRHLTITMVAAIIVSCVPDTVPSVSAVSAYSDAQSVIDGGEQIGSATERVRREWVDPSSVRVLPGDGFTNTGGTIPAIIVASLAAEMTVDEQADWARRFRLRFSGDLSQIPTSVHYAPPQFGNQHYHRFDFEPSIRLRAGWYDMLVDLTGLDRSISVPGARPIGGRIVAVRFRADSHPIVSAIELRQVGIDRTVLTLRLSERVFASQGDFSVLANGARAECTLITEFSWPEGELPLDAPREEWSLAQQDLDFECVGRLDGGVEVVWNDGVRTEAGAVLSDFDERSPGRVLIDTTIPGQLAAGADMTHRSRLVDRW